jgi:hypothetical protein
MGIWMDWMTQGTRVTANLCYNNNSNDFFSEVNHGPYLVDNNLFLSRISLKSYSQGGAYVHNLAAGRTRLTTETRKTPYFKAHSTQVAGMVAIAGGDVRFYNNIFVAPADKDNQPGTYGLAVYNKAKPPMYVDGNIYLNGAAPYADESSRIEQSGFDPKIEVVEKGNDVYLHITVDRSWYDLQNKLVTTKLLGKARVPDLPHVNRDDTPLKVDTDYFGKKRNDKNPTAGPFANPGQGRLSLKVWPVQ